MRKTVRQAILGCATVVSRIPAQRWLERSALGPETVPERPFGVVTQVGPSGILWPVRASADAPTDFEIWVHDEPGSYLQIDDILSDLMDYFEGLSQFSYGGFRIAQVDPQGMSADLSDDAMRTVTRSLRIRVVGGRM